MTFVEITPYVIIRASRIQNVQYFQRDALNNVRLANVLCANTGLTRVQRDVFRMASFPGEFEDCEDLAPLNLEPWKENPAGTSL